MLDDALGQETEHAEAKYEEQDDSASPAGPGFARQVPDDEQHVQDERSDAESQTESCDLLFRKAKHENSLSPD